MFHEHVILVVNKFVCILHIQFRLRNCLNIVQHWSESSLTWSLLHDNTTGQDEGETESTTIIDDVGTWHCCRSCWVSLYLHAVALLPVVPHADTVIWVSHTHVLLTCDFYQVFQLQVADSNKFPIYLCNYVR